MQRLRKLFHHLFIPHEKNGYKPKLLHHDALTIVIIVLLIVNVSLKFVAEKQWTSVLGVSMNVSVQDLVRYTNEERASHGLPPLQYDQTLAEAAKQKADHMIVNNYWSHFAPDGTSPWSFFEKSGYKYILAGENLAKDFSASRSIVDAWMNSEKHRENILQSQYSSVGFAVREGILQGKPTVLVVQFFATPDPDYIATQKTSEPEKNTVVTSSNNGKGQPAVAAVRTTTLDAHALAKRISIGILALLLVALSFDLYFMEKRGFSRAGAKSYAHLVVIVIIIVGIILINPGNIL